MPTKNICIFGDSIAYGEWTHHLGWADQLQNTLQQKTLESKFTLYYFLYNLSIPGNTTEDVLKRFQIEAEAREPHIIIFAVGTNDSSCREKQNMPLVPSEVEGRVSPDRFRENVRMLIDKAKHRTHMIVWIGLTGVDEARTTPFETTYFSNERIGTYDAIIKEICAEYHVPHLDLLAMLQPQDLEDGLHPNKQGHDKLFHAVLDFLVEKQVI
ncbi:MAG: hypothetical protein HY617_03765 [Candidatus Sungbacteria bacterium]|nr:hypothetical protein [Candidatus Sungbacteria bacterium]